MLLLDGIFLHRDELVSVWDFSVYLEVPEETSVARMVERDGANPDPNHPTNTRYVQGQRLYLDACRPWERATVAVENADWRDPVLRVAPNDSGPRSDGAPDRVRPRVRGEALRLAESRQVLGPTR